MPLNKLERCDATAKAKARIILQTLKTHFPQPSWTEPNGNPFAALIQTVLSQATTDRNSTKAFQNLSKKFPISPEALEKADVREISRAIKSGGLFRSKAKTIKNVSRIILEEYDGSINFIHSIPLEIARKALQGLPGVGPKTADVVLLFCANRPIIPVDTHVDRVSKRLRFVSATANYECVRRTLQCLYASEDYLSAHISLISLGRKYCKARRPLCDCCIVNKLCPSRIMKAEQNLHQVGSQSRP